jgi:hypothetical protein
MRTQYPLYNDHLLHKKLLVICYAFSTMRILRGLTVLGNVSRDTRLDDVKTKLLEDIRENRYPVTTAVGHNGAVLVDERRFAARVGEYDVVDRTIPLGIKLVAEAAMENQTYFRADGEQIS